MVRKGVQSRIKSKVASKGFDSKKGKKVLGQNIKDVDSTNNVINVTELERMNEVSNASNVVEVKKVLNDTSKPGLEIGDVFIHPDIYNGNPGSFISIPIYVRSVKSSIFANATVHHPGTFRDTVRLADMLKQMISGVSNQRIILKAGLAYVEELKCHYFYFGQQNVQEDLIILDAYAYYLIVKWVNPEFLQAMYVDLEDGSQGIDLEQAIAEIECSNCNLKCTDLSNMSKPYFDLLAAQCAAGPGWQGCDDRVIAFGNVLDMQYSNEPFTLQTSGDATVFCPSILASAPVFSIAYFPMELSKKIEYLLPPKFEVYDTKTNTVIQQYGQAYCIKAKNIDMTLIFDESVNGYILDENSVSKINQISEKAGTYAGRNVIKIDQQGDLKCVGFIVHQPTAQINIEQYLVIHPAFAEIIDSDKHLLIKSITVPCQQDCMIMGQQYQYQTYRLDYNGRIFTAIDGYGKVLFNDSLYEGLIEKPTLVGDEYGASTKFLIKSKQDVIETLAVSVYKAQGDDAYACLTQNLPIFLQFISSKMFFLPIFQHIRYIQYVMPQKFKLNETIFDERTNKDLSRILIKLKFAVKPEYPTISCSRHSGSNQYDFACSRCLEGLVLVFKSSNGEMDKLYYDFWQYFGDVSRKLAVLKGFNLLYTTKANGEKRHNCRSCSKPYTTVKEAMICCIQFGEMECKSEYEDSDGEVEEEIEIKFDVEAIRKKMNRLMLTFQTLREQFSQEQQEIDKSSQRWSNYRNSLIELIDVFSDIIPIESKKTHHLVEIKNIMLDKLQLFLKDVEACPTLLPVHEEISSERSIKPDEIEESGRDEVDEMQNKQTTLNVPDIHESEPYVLEQLDTLQSCVPDKTVQCSINIEEKQESETVTVNQPTFGGITCSVIQKPLKSLEAINYAAIEQFLQHEREASNWEYLETNKEIDLEEDSNYLSVMREVRAFSNDIQKWNIEHESSIDTELFFHYEKLVDRLLKIENLIQEYKLENVEKQHFDELRSQFGKCIEDLDNNQYVDKLEIGNYVIIKNVIFTEFGKLVFIGDKQEEVKYNWKSPLMSETNRGVPLLRMFQCVNSLALRTLACEPDKHNDMIQDVIMILDRMVKMME